MAISTETSRTVGDERKTAQFQRLLALLSSGTSRSALSPFALCRLTGALAAFATALITLNPLWIVAGFVFGYAMAWVGHFTLEGNRPATFGNPAWSLMGDIRMYVFWLTGRLDAELEAAEHMPEATKS